MKLVTYNIQYGRGKDGQFDLVRIADEVMGADVIALQEVERFWQRSGMVDQPAELATLLGDYHWVYGSGVDSNADGANPEGKPLHRRRQFGNMLLAKTPILTVRNHLLPKFASLGPMSLQRSALEGVIESKVGLVRVYSIHLTHLAAETRLPQIETLLAIHRRAPEEGQGMTGNSLEAEWTQDGMPGPMPANAILMGDFNCEPDSLEYARIVGPYSVYGGRVTNPQGFVDAWVVTGHDERGGVTADIGGRPVRLDYCFVSAELKDRLNSVEVSVDAQGSDHQPVWVDISI